MVKTSCSKGPLYFVATLFADICLDIILKPFCQASNYDFVAASSIELRTLYERVLPVWQPNYKYE